MSTITGKLELSFLFTYPETVDPRLSSIPVQPEAIRIPGQPVHDGPAHAAGLVDLQAEVVVGARDGVVVLVDDEVGALWACSLGAVERRVGGDGEEGRPEDVGLEGVGEEGEVVRGGGVAGLDGGG